MAPPSYADAPLNLSVRRRGAVQPHQASHAGHSLCVYRACPGRAGTASKERSTERTRLDARSTSLASAHGEHGAHRLNERFTPCRSGGGHSPTCALTLAHSCSRSQSPSSRSRMSRAVPASASSPHRRTRYPPRLAPARSQHARIATHSARRDSAVQNSGHYGGTTGVFSLMPVCAHASVVDVPVPAGTASASHDEDQSLRGSLARGRCLPSLRSAVKTCPYYCCCRRCGRCRCGRSRYCRPTPPLSTRPPSAHALARR